jgi:hypothetical protein
VLLARPEIIPFNFKLSLPRGDVFADAFFKKKTSFHKPNSWVDDRFTSITNKLDTSGLDIPCIDFYFREWGLDLLEDTRAINSKILKFLISSHVFKLKRKPDANWENAKQHVTATASSLFDVSLLSVYSTSIFRPSRLVNMRSKRNSLIQTMSYVRRARGVLFSAYLSTKFNMLLQDLSLLLNKNFAVITQLLFLLYKVGFFFYESSQILKNL